MIRQMFALMFKASGWKFVNQVPDDLRSFVFLGAPHTSNHDFIPAMAVSYFMKRKAHFVIKHTWMKFPMNLFFKPIGGVSVDRRQLGEGKSANNTDLMASLFKDQSEFVLMIAPEGTRKPNPKWKTGFYYIAQKANVPIVCGFCDYKKKEAGLGLVIYPKNFEEDMLAITNFYRGYTGAVPENFLLDERFDHQGRT